MVPVHRPLLRHAEVPTLPPPHPLRLMPHPFWYRLILLPVGCRDRLAETVRFVSPRDSPERGAPLHAGPNVRRVGAGQLHLGAPDAPPGSAPSRHRHGAWVPRSRRVLRCGAFFLCFLSSCAGDILFLHVLALFFVAVFPPLVIAFVLVGRGSLGSPRQARWARYVYFTMCVHTKHTGYVRVLRVSFLF